MNAEMKKLVVDKINANRKLTLENQVQAIAVNIQQQLDYMVNNANGAKANIAASRKQIEALNGTLGQPLTAEEIFGKEEVK